MKQFEEEINKTDRYENYRWLVTPDKEFYYQFFFGKWKVIEMITIDVSIPSIYMGFDENDNIRGQDLIDNIIGQELYFGADYIANKGIEYKLEKGYKTYSVPLLNQNTIIGCNYAKSLGINGDYFSIVFFSLGIGKKEGSRDFTSLNQLYLKDINTIYASVNGCMTFLLKRC